MIRAATDSRNLAEKGFAAAQFNLAQTYKQVTILKFNKPKKQLFTGLKPNNHLW